MKRKIIFGLFMIAAAVVVLGNFNVTNNAETVPIGPAIIESYQ